MTIAIARSLGHVAFHARFANAPRRGSTAGARVRRRRGRGQSRRPRSTSSRSWSVIVAASVATSGESMRRGRGIVDVVDGGDPARPAREQHDAVAEAHRFAHVVRHEDDGLAGRRPQRFELVVQAVAGHRVERAERLVHQQHVGVLRERAGERGALAHAARELVRPALGEVAEVHHLEQLLRARPALGARHARELQRELDVAAHGEPREERGLLEHQAGALGAHVDAARRGLVEAGDEVEQRALAAARRAEQAHELALLDVEGDAFERDDALAAGAERPW